MKTFIRVFLIISFAVSLFLIPSANIALAKPADAICKNVSEIPIRECNVLVALFNSTNGASWSDHTNWLINNTPANWYGITVNEGHVTEIILENNNLGGELPRGFGKLAALEILWLRDNPISGPIPPEISRLSALRILDLGFTEINGRIPPQIGNLTALEWLNLTEAELSGTLPHELGNLTSLIGLELEHNENIFGIIPPEFGNLASLQLLHLDENSLYGSLPSELGNLTSLTSLRVYNNPMSGDIPLSLMNLSELDEFNFDLTGLCEPDTPEYLLWKSSVPDYTGTGLLCETP